MTSPAPDSELIVNSDGSVYHLGLLPEHITPLIITVGDPERVPEVSKHFEEVDFRQNTREFVTHVGRFAGRRIMCISTGIGTDNVDIVLNELDAIANVDFGTKLPKAALRQLTFVRLGTSGTFQADIPVDTVLASRTAVGVDGLGPFYRFGGGEAQRVLTAAYPAFAAASYTGTGEDELLRAWLAHSEANRSGCTLTCAGFYGPQRRSLRLPYVGPGLAELARLRFADGGRFTNFEMETAGLYGLSNLLGHRALSLSAVLANRATGEFSVRASETVGTMITRFFDCVERNPNLWFGATS